MQWFFAFWYVVHQFLIRLNHSCSSSVRPHSNTNTQVRVDTQARRRARGTGDPGFQWLQKLWGRKANTSALSWLASPGVTAFWEVVTENGGPPNLPRTCNLQPQLAKEEAQWFFRVTILWFHYLSMSCRREKPWSWSVIEYTPPKTNISD